MRHSSSVAPLESSLEGVHPILGAALDSLDVELEEELTRYRRQKHRMARQVGHKQHIPTWKPTYRSVQKPAIDLPFHTSPPVLDQPEANQLQHLVRQTEVVNQTLRQESRQTFQQMPDARSATQQNRATVKGVNPEVDVWADADPTPNQAHPGQGVSESSVERSLEQPLQPLQQSTRPLTQVSASAVGGKLTTVSARSQSQDSPSLPPEESEAALTPSSALVVQPHRSIDSAGFSDPSAGFSDPEDSPDDYLESSEELLRSMGEETLDRAYEQETTLLDSMLSPLGIGSMLLLLLSTATLGYVVMHPSSLDFLTAPEQSRSESTDSIASPTPTGSGFVPDSPNLAAEEFVDLNVNNLSTLPKPSRPNSVASPLPNAPTTGASPVPGMAVSPQLPQTGSQTPDSYSSYAQPAPNPAPVVPPSAPPAPVSVAPPAYDPPVAYEPPATIDYPPPIDYPPEVAASTPTSSSAPYYYVVTPYSGDPSLENAREAVPEAYVRNFDAGASVQLGAFSDPAKAEELVQQLESQGIPAEIYHP
jgi:hypothetical protein